MKNNTLIIAAAGSGKTTLLADRALSVKSETVLITTYTESNEQEIRRKIISKAGYLPSNVTIQTWFSFLLQHGVRPYQSVMDEGLHEKDVGFYLTNGRSGQKLDKAGKPVLVKGYPSYWGEDNFYKHYFTKDYRLFSDKASKFVVMCSDKLGGEVIDRISRIYRNIYIDEVQDLAGYDLEIVKRLFKTSSRVLLVGDPRQVTYLTHNSTKFPKYRNGDIKGFVQKEIGRKTICEIDENTLSESHRNNDLICQYAAKLYPEFPCPAACKCKGCRDLVSDHEGVFAVRKSDLGHYLSRYEPVQLRWNSNVPHHENYPVKNMGESKGMTFERVLIYPTEDMTKWVRDNSAALKDEARAKFYVALTRARRSASILLDFEDSEELNGVQKFSCCG